MTEQKLRTRTTFFQVKNETAFRSWATSKHLGVIDEKRNGKTYFALHGKDETSAGWPATIYDEVEKRIKIEVSEELGKHLKKGPLVAFIASRKEGGVEFSGLSISAESNKKTAHVDFHDVLKTSVYLGAELNIGDL